MTLLPPVRCLTIISTPAGAMPLYGATAYGASSCPGPIHTVEGYPAIGTQYLPVVTNGPAGGRAFFAFGWWDFEGPFLGGDLLVNPTNMLLPAPRPIDAMGRAMMPLPIPPLPNLIGLDVYSQALVLGGQGQPCMTNGQHTRLGR